MAKKPIKSNKKPETEAPEGVQEEILDDAAPPDVTEEVQGDDEAVQPPFDDELIEEDGEEYDEPAPAPARSKGKKRGRPPKAARVDSGPLSLSDVVNSTDANEAWWQEHRLVIYRKDISKDMKALMKADSGRTWIDRISGPFTQDEFDESYLRARYGGGLFQVYLQEKPTGGNKWDALMEAEYVIAGPPKYTDEEAAAARRANPNQQSQSTVTAAGDRTELGTVLDLLQRQIERADAPQAAAMASLADTMRTGQQASTQMLMETMRQVMEMRNQPNNGGSEKLIEMLMGMVVDQMKRPAETQPQKSGLDQLREMLELQKIVQGLQPRREAGPFDEVAKALMLRAAETVVPGATGATVVAGGGESWIEGLVKSLAPQIPALIQGVTQFITAQQRAANERLDREFRYRAALIDRQRGLNPAPAGADATNPLAGTQSPLSEEEQAQLQLQQVQQAQAAAQMELFNNALTKMFFESEHPEDAAITLSAAFPAVVEGLKAQLTPYGEWWANPGVMAFLKSTYPALGPVLNSPQFPAWIAPVWVELTQVQIAEDEGENEEENEAVNSAPIAP